MAKFDFKNAAKRNKNLKYGGYATIITVIAVIILVVVNMMFEQLHLTIDLTQEELYSVSDETMEILDNLDQDVEIYGFYASGDEKGTYSSMVISFLEEYSNLNRHIHFEIKDPVGDPAFAGQFLNGLDETISSGNVVVTAKDTGRYKILALSDILSFSYDSSSSSGYRVSGWNAEASITGAVQYVTSEETPVIYQLVGHSEATLDDAVVSYLNKSNFDVETLNLLTGGEISPENYNIIIVNSPKTDLQNQEYDTLIDYMEHGGRLIFMCNFDLPVMTNFDRLLDRFGLSIDRNGFVFETDPTRYYVYPNIVMPEKIDAASDETGIIENMGEDNVVLMYNPAAITINENRNRLTNITSLLYTSGDALIKGEGNTLIKYEEGDEKGPFNLVVMATEQEQLGNNVETAELCVIGNATFVDNAYAESINMGGITSGNYEMFLYICNYMQDQVDQLYIPAKEFSSEYLITSMGTAITGGVIFVIAIPVIIIGIGIFIWVRRKNL